MSSNSNRKSRARKSVDRPKKPYPDFPLSPHASGAWQKKIRGKVHYFGKWGRVVNGVLTRVEGDGWKEALEIYKAQAHDLHAGRFPRRDNGEGLTVRGICNRFLTSKMNRMNTGELSPRTFQDYKVCCDRLIRMFGKNRLVDDLASDDFAALRNDISKSWGPIRLGNEVTRVRTLFRFAYESRLIDRPVRFGPEFVKPSMRVLRKHRAANGKRLFEPAEVRLLLAEAPGQIQAWVLLGINATLGNTDIADLQLSHLDLDGGWLDYARGKTGIERRSKLWPETVTALREAIASRPKSKAPEDDDCVFLTSRGTRLVRPTGSSRSDSVTLEFKKLRERLGINGRRGFYGLRLSHRTASDGARDTTAANLIMGHSDNSMAANYTHGIDDDRLVAVAEHVRGCLFGQEGGAK